MQKLGYPFELELKADGCYKTAGFSSPGGPGQGAVVMQSAVDFPLLWLERGLRAE